ncbi:protein-arginine omega-N asymmetric methyltransferase [Aureococcus anophagefferens]|nr:protein-arginine omega-N asymmetric methyltransferase [Aureococcus anophagefferens]
MARPRLAGCAARRLALVLLAFRASCYDRPRVVRLHPGPRLAAHAEYEVSWTATDLGTADEAWIEFDLKHYQSMVNDGPRTALFLDELERRLAATARAATVYAIEAVPMTALAQSGSARQCGREFAEGVVEVLEGFSTDVALPEKVDLVIFEIAGSIASEEGCCDDARRDRFLARPDAPSSIPHAYQTLGAPATDLCHHGGGVEDPGAPVLRVQSDDATLGCSRTRCSSRTSSSAPLPRAAPCRPRPSSRGPSTARASTPTRRTSRGSSSRTARVEANGCDVADLADVSDDADGRRALAAARLQQTATVLAAMVSVHRRLVALCVVGVVGVARGRETRLAKASGPPSFFLQDAAADGLCLGDGAFKRCGIDTLWYVTGSAGAYSIHKRKVDDVDEDLCLDRASCDLPDSRRRRRRAMGGDGDSSARPATATSGASASCSGTASPSTRGTGTASPRSSRRRQGQRRRRRSSAPGADPAAGDKDNITALMEAAIGGHADVAARPRGRAGVARGGGGVTALARAGEGRRRAELLLGRGADASNARSDGITALMAAATGGHAAVVAASRRRRARRRPTATASRRS